MLPGEEFERLLEDKALWLDFTADLVEGHLVLGLDRNIGILAAELDQDQPAARLQSLEQPEECELGGGAFVVDVDHQNQVDRPLR